MGTWLVFLWFTISDYEGSCIYKKWNINITTCYISVFFIMDTKHNMAYSPDLDELPLYEENEIDWSKMSLDIILSSSAVKKTIFGFSIG